MSLSYPFWLSRNSFISSHSLSLNNIIIFWNNCNMSIKIIIPIIFIIINSVCPLILLLSFHYVTWGWSKSEKERNSPHLFPSSSCSSWWKQEKERRDGGIFPSPLILPKIMFCSSHHHPDDALLLLIQKDTNIADDHVKVYLVFGSLLLWFWWFPTLKINLMTDCF